MVGFRLHKKFSVAILQLGTNSTEFFPYNLLASLLALKFIAFYSTYRPIYFSPFYLFIYILFEQSLLVSAIYY